MAKKLEYEIVTDASKGIAGLKQFSSAAKKAMKDVEGSFDDTTTSAQKVAKALSGLADEIETEMKGAAKAAGALSDALGPELAGRANVDQLVTDLRKMGLTFDEITADADSLAGSLKKLDTVQMGGIEAATRRTKGNIDDVGKSADSSKGALANMVGNSAQDLGALGGVAGSTGVAIGQMAEYMADAALEGETLGAVVKNFAKVAVPILAIGAAIGVFQSALGSLKKDEEEATRITEDLGNAFKETGDWTQAATKVLRDHADEFENYTNRITSVGEAIDATVLGKGLAKLPAIGDHFKQTSIDVEEALGRVGKSMDDLAETTEGNVIFNREFEQALRDGVATGKLSEQEYKDLADAVHSYQIATKGAKEEQAKLNLSAKRFHDLAELITLQADPLAHFTELWDQLFEAIRTGNDVAGAAIANTLAALLHIPDPAQVVELALGRLADVNDEVAKSFDDTAKALEDWADRTEAAISKAVDTTDAQRELDELAGSFGQMETASDALSAVFDLGNKPLETLGEIRDIDQAMRDLQTFIAKDLKGTIPNLFDPNDVNADDFLAKISSLREQIQSRVIEAFAGGGGPAAVATADAYVNQLFAALKGKLSKEQIRKLLGLDDLEVKIKPAIDKTAADNAKRELEILTGLQGASPWTASIALALQEGTISPQAAKILIERELKKAGVEIPSKLATPETGTAKREADQWAAQRDNQIKMGTELTAPSDVSKQNAHTDGQNFANRHPVVFPSMIAPPTGKRAVPGLGIALDSGGVAGPYGGLVAEKGPEIINRRFLAVSPTVVPPGTRVTSRRQTARVLRVRGARGLKRYDAGGVVSGGTVNVNFNGVGAIGNRYDLMRLVTKAQLDKIRLLGSRG